jgi:hypothetical protein
LRCCEGRTLAADASAPICTHGRMAKRQVFFRRAALRASALEPLADRAAPGRTSSSGCGAKRMRRALLQGRGCRCGETPNLLTANTATIRPPVRREDVRLLPTSRLRRPVPSAARYGCDGIGYLNILPRRSDGH